MEDDFWSKKTKEAWSEMKTNSRKEARKIVNEACLPVYWFFLVLCSAACGAMLAKWVAGEFQSFDASVFTANLVGAIVSLAWIAETRRGRRKRNELHGDPSAFKTSPWAWPENSRKDGK